LRIFLSLFNRNPKDLADAADQKKGEKQAVKTGVWKTLIRRTWSAGNDHKMLGSSGECTQDVARGTVIRVRSWQCAVRSSGVLVILRREDAEDP
jgi:hypothetical protein